MKNLNPPKKYFLKIKGNNKDSTREVCHFIPKPNSTFALYLPVTNFPIFLTLVPVSRNSYSLLRVRFGFFLPSSTFDLSFECMAFISLYNMIFSFILHLMLPAYLNTFVIILTVMIFIIYTSKTWECGLSCVQDELPVLVECHMREGRRFDLAISS